MNEPAGIPRCSDCGHKTHRAGRCDVAVGIDDRGGDAMCMCPRDWDNEPRKPLAALISRGPYVGPAPASVEDLGVGLARELLAYFGDDEPIDPLLTTDIALRQQAREIIARVDGVPARPSTEPAWQVGLPGPIEYRPDPVTRERNGNVLQLAERRPPKDITPPFDLVEKWLAEARAANLPVSCVAIHWTETRPNGCEAPHTWTAGLNPDREIALAVLAVKRGLEEWLT